MRMPGRLAMDVASHHRPPCLLQLQEEDIVRTAPLEQHNVAAQSDAADANDFVRHIDQRITGDNTPPVGTSRVDPVRALRSE